MVKPCHFSHFIAQNGLKLRPSFEILLLIALRLDQAASQGHCSRAYIQAK